MRKASEIESDLKAAERRVAELERELRDAQPPAGGGPGAEGEPMLENNSPRE